MTTATLTTGIAWGVPVAPDILGTNLEVYLKLMPAFQTLRLCHRFGKGQDVQITRLPLELLLRIEELLAKDARSGAPRDWTSSFRCFESRCEPILHDTSETGEGLIDAASEAFETDCTQCSILGIYGSKGPCESMCKSDSEAADQCLVCKGDMAGAKCRRTCSEMFNAAMNEIMWDVDLDWLEDHYMERDSWMIKVASVSGHQDMFRKTFGLEIMFVTTRLSSEQRNLWSKAHGPLWYPQDGLETTLCYLTLPKRESVQATYESSDVEDDGGGPVCVPFAQVVPAQLPKSILPNGGRCRFQRALKILGLEAYRGFHQEHSITAELSREETNEQTNGTVTPMQPQLLVLASGMAMS